MKKYYLPRLKDEVIRLFDISRSELLITPPALELLTSYIYAVGTELAWLAKKRAISNHRFSKVKSRDVIEAHRQRMHMDAEHKEILLDMFNEGIPSIYQQTWLESIPSIAEGSFRWSEKAIRFFLLYLQVLTEEIIDEVASNADERTLNAIDFDKVLGIGEY